MSERTKTVLVLGGTGRTGRRIVNDALEAGLTPVVFGRSASADRVPDGARAFAGDVLDPAALDAALDGVDAVITALSIPRRTRSPFAEVTGPADLHSRSTALLVDAMRARGLTRWIKLSAQGVGSSAVRAGWGFRLLVASSNLRPAFDDHAIADAALMQTDLRWTIVRPPILSDAPPTGSIRAREDATTWTWTRVATGDVSRWIVAALDDASTERKVLTLTP